MATERTVLRAARLVDVVAQRVVRDAAVVVEDGRVAGVTQNADAPSDARTVDLGDRTLLPGLMDMHTHLVGRVDSGHGYAGLVARTGAQEVMTGVRNARATIEAGFT